MTLVVPGQMERFEGELYKVLWTSGVKQMGAEAVFGDVRRGITGMKRAASGVTEVVRPKKVLK